MSIDLKCKYVVRMKTCRKRRGMLRFTTAKATSRGSEHRFFSNKECINWECGFLKIPFQPSMVLHELSHGLHFRSGEKIDNLINKCFLGAKQAGKYENVWHWNKSIG